MKRQDLYDLHDNLCRQAKNLMSKKNQDYGENDDPFRNFHMFGHLGILVRMSDKLARLRTYVERGTLAVADESMTDSAIDLINYAVLFVGYDRRNFKYESEDAATRSNPIADAVRADGRGVGDRDQRGQSDPRTFTSSGANSVHITAYGGVGGIGKGGKRRDKGKEGKRTPVVRRWRKK